MCFGDTLRQSRASCERCRDDSKVLGRSRDAVPGNVRPLPSGSSSQTVALDDWHLGHRRFLAFSDPLKRPTRDWLIPFAASASTCTPLTKTWTTPVANCSGFSYVDCPPIVLGSKTTTSAKLPGVNTPRLGMPRVIAGREVRQRTASGSGITCSSRTHLSKIAGPVAAMLVHALRGAGRGITHGLAQEDLSRAQAECAAGGCRRCPWIYSIAKILFPKEARRTSCRSMDLSKMAEPAPEIVHGHFKEGVMTR